MRKDFCFISFNFQVPPDKVANKQKQARLSREELTNGKPSPKAPARFFSQIVTGEEPCSQTSPQCPAPPKAPFRYHHSECHPLLSKTKTTQNQACITNVT